MTSPTAHTRIRSLACPRPAAVPPPEGAPARGTKPRLPRPRLPLLIGARAGPQGHVPSRSRPPRQAVLEDRSIPQCSWRAARGGLEASLSAAEAPPLPERSSAPTRAPPALPPRSPGHARTCGGAAGAERAGPREPRGGGGDAGSRTRARTCRSLRGRDCAGERRGAR